jgi:hypothetical protein
MDIFWKFGMLRVCTCRAREKKKWPVDKSDDGAATDSGAGVDW